MADCLFCKIIAGDIPTEKVYEDDHVVVINDIKPQAPSHKLILPKQHICTLNDLTERDESLVGHMIRVGQMMAKKLDHHQQGYRLVFNCNEHGGQTVFHIHLHLLSGRRLAWPPG